METHLGIKQKYKGPNVKRWKDDGGKEIWINTNWARDKLSKSHKKLQDHEHVVVNLLATVYVIV